MAIYYSLHPQNPQARDLKAIVKELKNGAVMLYPTDTVYAIGCDLMAKKAIDRVRQIKKMANDKPLTFLCSSLSNISEYAGVNDQAYRLMKNLIPGPYTFVLPGSRQVPKLVLSPKRKTTGIRVPNHIICQEILKELGNPIISTSAHLPDNEGDYPTIDREKALLFDTLDGLVDIVIDTDKEPGFNTSTVLDLTQENPEVIRQGMGWEEVKPWLG
jgi:tRNA threonylcarbamoyl adenosine modification protein (Sua5/YciO/YrdC/YwlC family)